MCSFTAPIHFHLPVFPPAKAPHSCLAPLHLSSTWFLILTLVADSSVRINIFWHFDVRTVFHKDGDTMEGVWRIRRRKWKTERDKDTERKKQERCEGSSVGSLMYNLIVCVWKWAVVRMVLNTTVCVCECVRGCPYWQLPMLPPQAVFGEACHCCCGLAEVNGEGVYGPRCCSSLAPRQRLRPCPLSQSLTASWPLTTYQLTRPGGWEQIDKGRGVGEGYAIGREAGDWARLTMSVQHSFSWGAKGESTSWAREPLICGWGGHQEPPYNNYIRVK